MRVLVVIPARMAATRLPGKPLAQIAGRPMIAHMAAIAAAADLGPVLVAAGEREIAAAAEAAGAQAVLTDPALPSGTDRVAAAIAGRAADVVVNLQGDMPTFDPRDLRAAALLLAERPEADLATLVSPSTDPTHRRDPSVVKAIVAYAPDGETGRALYFTRADAPSGEGPVDRHIGVYAYRPAALARFVAAPPSRLERREGLEQLRALELGLEIAVRAIPRFPKGVDTPADLDAVRAGLEAPAP